MMKKVVDSFGSDRLLRLTVVLFVTVYVIFNIKGFVSRPLAVSNQDRYKDLFESFLVHGYYESVVRGTSILYNASLSGIYFFTQSTDASFFILNALSDLAMLLMGAYFCLKIAGRNKYALILATAFVLQILGLRSYLRASNDSFLGVFVIILLYLLVIKIYERKNESRTFLQLGLVFGICLCIRVTAFLLIPLIVAALIWWMRNTIVEMNTRIKLVSLFTIASVAVVTALHFPSLAENQKLSYENKDPGDGTTWMQRNYLGLKKIENGQEKMHRDAIWKHTSFEEVAAYLEKNGKESIPDSFLIILTSDPFLVMKMTLYNAFSITGRFIRFWGFLFFVPFFGLFMNRFFAPEKLPGLLLTAYTVCICIICFSFVEYRWFIGYEVLIPVGTLAFFSKSAYFADDKRKNSTIIASLLLLTLFNLKSIIF